MKKLMFLCLLLTSVNVYSNASLAKMMYVIVPLCLGDGCVI